MTASPNRRNTYHHIKLPDNPIGWYQLCTSKELLHGQTLQRFIAGQEVVLYRAESGTAHVIDPFCPHLGAHFHHGGTIEGDELVCPFHGFRFDRKGTCTKTAYGSKPPPRSKVYHWPVQEVNGFVFVYYHPEAKEPDFFLPTWEDSDWTPIKTTAFELNGHPQETTENSVDIGHFATVHQYTDIREISKMQCDGSYLTARYGMTRATSFMGFSIPPIHVEFEIHVYGLGYSFVVSRVKNFGITARFFVLSTPLGDGRINLRIACSMKKIESSRAVSPWLGFVPKDLLTNIVFDQIYQSYRGDVLQDYDIWNNKIHIVPPILAKGDGPVGRYRHWAKQFYTNYPQKSSNAS